MQTGGDDLMLHEKEPEKDEDGNVIGEEKTFEEKAILKQR